MFTSCKQTGMSAYGVRADWRAAPASRSCLRRARFFSSTGTFICPGLTIILISAIPPLI